MNDAQSLGNSLEIVKLVISVLTPLSIVGLGYFVNRLVHRIQQAQWANQKVIEKRIVVFDKVAPLLNDVYCYFRFVGNWKELSPKEIIRAKRTLDKEMNIYSPLFSQELMRLYNQFIKLCFETYSGVGHDAKLRTPIASADGDRKSVFPGQWIPEWNHMFADPSKHSDYLEIIKVYNKFTRRFSDELGIGLENDIV